MTIWFASGNRHKQKELGAILGAAVCASQTPAPETPPLSPHPAFGLKIPADAGLAFNPQETGSSFSENAMIKARELFRLLNDAGHFHPGDAIIADDSGICVDALNGRPGIYSARYAGAPGRELAAIPEDSVKNTLLLAEMEGRRQRSARFVCAMALLYSADNFYIAQETLEGCIAEKPSGAAGFGYDPILFIPEMGRTVAELSEAEKNTISHRGKALRALAKFLININHEPH